MSLRKAMDEAFEKHINGGSTESISADAPARISRYDFEAGYRAALNKPDGEPVAWVYFNKDHKPTIFYVEDAAKLWSEAKGLPYFPLHPHSPLLPAEPKE